MHLLLTNDDGIQADGLAALQRAAARVASRVTIVAPAEEQSMCGHRVTTYRPLTMRELGPGRYSVDGTPADCVRAGLFALGLTPDAVLSGVNHGGNLGQDIVISGTMAGAREAAYHGVRAIAFSHYLISGMALDWARITEWIAKMLRAELASEPVDGRIVNINFPHLPPGDIAMPPVADTRPARSPLNVSFLSEPSDGATLLRYSARYADRPRDAGSDVQACFGGKISRTVLSL